MSTSLTVGAALPGEQFAALGTATANLIAKLQDEANSPVAEAAAQAKEKLAQWDQLATAQATNDIATERAFLERRMAQIG